MTLGVYSGGPSDEQRRACVEAVRLPQTVAASLGKAAERDADMVPSGQAAGTA